MVVPLLLVVVVGQIDRKDLCFVSCYRKALHLFASAQVRRRDSYCLKLDGISEDVCDELWFEEFGGANKGVARTRGEGANKVISSHV